MKRFGEDPIMSIPFILTCSAQLVSQIGDAAYIVALPWAIYSVTGSFLYTGTVTAVMTVAKLSLASVGGTLADRFDRKLLMITADVIRGVALGLTTLIFRGGSPDLVHLCVMAAILGAADCLYLPAHFGLVPRIVPQDSYQRANAIVTLIGQVALLIGPAVAGFAMVTLGPAWLFAFDGLTFFVSACLIIPVIQRQDAIRTSAGSISFLRQLKDGLLPLRRIRSLQALVIPGFILNPVIDSTWSICLPALIADVLLSDSRVYGTTLTAFAIGALVCSLVLGRIKLRRLLAVFYINSCVGGLCFVLLGMAPNTRALVVTGGIIGMLVALSRITHNTAMYKMVSQEYLGRVQGLTRSIAMALLPGAYLAVGYVGRLISLRYVFVLAAVISLLVNGLFFALYRDVILRPTEREEMGS